MTAFVTHTRLTLSLVLLVAWTQASGGEVAPIDLSGEWRLLIESDTNPGDSPQAISASETVQLPGSMQEQGKGDAVAFDSPWTPKPPADSDYYTSDRYEPYRNSDNPKVPFALQPKRMYVGAASYERAFDAPVGWESKRVVLCLERPHWFTQVWVDGASVGTGDSLSTPHRFELPKGLVAGTHTIRVRVDNRLHVNVGESAHSVSDHTQTNWNGLVGGINLRVTPRVWIDRFRVVSDTRAKRFKVRVKIGNLTDNSSESQLDFAATPRSGGATVTASSRVTVGAGGADSEATVDLGPNAELWDEFDPALYDVQVTLHNADGSQHRQSVVTGLREIGASGTQITMNGRPVFLRGTLECCVFPKTGYPPTEVGPWKQLFRRCQEFGLNHVRFHSYCPPEAAFAAADELGVYLQPEAACWTEVGDGEPVDDWIFAETQRILDEYGNHPSFVMMAYGNEPHPNKPTRDAYLAKWATHFRGVDSHRVYSCASGWPTLSDSDFHVLPRPRLHQWGEGMRSRLNSKPPTTTPDYRSFVSKHDRPVVAHEIGQWCAYPDFGERADYDGVTRAENLVIFEDFLNQAGMGDLAEAFHMASGALQEVCYKEEVEASLRTPGLAGFQLLGLSDFPGQGTALVGLCDAFWNVKRYASAERFRCSCNDVVALARLPKRVYSTGETLEASLEVANFGPDALRDSTWRWRLECRQAVVEAGSLSVAEAPTGKSTRLGTIRVDLSKLDAPCEATLFIDGPDGVTNRWSVWIYPDDAAAQIASGVSLHRSFDAAARSALQAGETVVLFADPNTVKSEVQVGFTPIFWNTSYTTNQPPHTLGLLIDPAHPAFAAFPTSTHSDWQWWEVIHGCRAMELDAMPTELKPLVRAIPDWFKPQRLALAFEARVGEGRLLACSADLEHRLGERHAARAFRKSLIEYVASDRFAPDTEVSAEQVSALFEPID